MLTSTQARIIAGCIWSIVGIYLFQLGYKLLNPHSLLSYSMIPLAITIGIFKGSFMLRSTALKHRQRLENQGELPLYRLYGLKQYVLIASMMTLSILLKKIEFPSLYRGILDLSIATALWIGSWTYFKKKVSYETVS